MRIVVFGLAVTSAWGNGHATLWRGLGRALAREGHEIVFFERDVPWYARFRDPASSWGCDVRLYASWDEVRARARRELASADAAMVTSYCPDAVDATELVLASGATSVFYDLDAPVTFSRLDAGEEVPYLPPGGLGAFELCLSFTGGRTLDAMRTRLGARRALPLYGGVDPDVHRPVAADAELACDLSYLGTYAPDRQDKVEALFLEPARRRAGSRFLLGGPSYPESLKLPACVRVLPHVSPDEHPRFYASSRLTLNVTRAPMAAFGFCPSARIFEAAACGAPVVTDAWEGLSTFFEPDHEILVARGTGDVLAALDSGPERLAALARNARERVLGAHTARHRAHELIELLGGPKAPAARPATRPRTRASE